MKKCKQCDFDLVKVKREILKDTVEYKRGQV
mgnify:CR=1 FL=1